MANNTGTMVFAAFVATFALSRSAWADPASPPHSDSGAVTPSLAAPQSNGGGASAVLRF